LWYRLSRAKIITGYHVTDMWVSNPGGGKKISPIPAAEGLTF